jgi:hypothetical protein
MGFTVSYDYGDDVKNIITQMFCVAFHPKHIILVSVMAVSLQAQKDDKGTSRQKESYPNLK